MPTDSRSSRSSLRGSCAFASRHSRTRQLTSAASARVTRSICIAAAAAAASSQPAREKMKTIAGSICLRARQRSTNGMLGTSSCACRLSERYRSRSLSRALPRPASPPFATPPPAPPRPPPPPRLAARARLRSFSCWCSAARASCLSAALSFHCLRFCTPLPPGPAPIEVKSGSSPAASLKWYRSGTGRNEVATSFVGAWMLESHSQMRAALAIVAESATKRVVAGVRMQLSSHTVPRCGSFM
mmetsp:Transcript_56408/g.129529  ORF Transcript_56408/g.129529 Transcript_56408/m.129529 type:complete len:243 (-) Transcript_56408:59-787(-)